MQVKVKSVDELIPYARNSRTHSEKQVLQIASSIREFGFNNPVLIDQDGGIIAGHGRVLAARKIGINEVPTIELSHLTETQKKAYVIADNKIALNAGWDEEMLKLELEELRLADFDIDLTGFTDEEFNLLMDEPEAQKEGLTDDDEVPAVVDNPITKPGDIWILGNHRVMCGDSTSLDDVEKLMAGGRAEICFTSPPYNAGSLNIDGNNRTQKKYNIFDDNQSEDDYFQFLVDNINCMIACSDEIFYNIGLVQNNKRVIFKLVDRFGDIFKDVIYWKKNTAAPHIQDGVINNLVEFIICFGDGKRKFINPQFSQGSYWNVIEGSNASGNEYSNIHKATFPLYLPENIIKNFTNKNATVIDCFGGTGTTLIACEKNNRVSMSMELDPRYCDVIVKRWQDFTGGDAVLESTGLTFNSYDK